MKKNVLLKSRRFYGKCARAHVIVIEGRCPLPLGTMPMHSANLQAAAEGE